MPDQAATTDHDMLDASVSRHGGEAARACGRLHARRSPAALPRRSPAAPGRPS
jgi:hypothetical protein